MKKPIITIVLILLFWHGASLGYGFFDFPSPQNLTVVLISDCTAELSWDMPAGAFPSYYLIYQNGEMIDSITVPVYTIELFFGAYNEFFVVAGYLNPNGVSAPSETVIIVIPGGYEMPYSENFEYCINWYSNPIAGNDNWYHCDSVYYEGSFSLGWYSENPGAITRCGPNYVINAIICPVPKVSFFYKIPGNGSDYDKLSIYLNDQLITDEFEMTDDWVYFETDIDVIDQFNFDFEAHADNGAGIFIDNLTFDYEVYIPDNNDNNIVQPEIFPNPAGNTINIRMNTVSNQNCIFEILTFDGRIIKQFNKIFTETGKETFTLNLADIKSGLYFLRILSGDDVVVKKLFIE